MSVASGSVTVRKRLSQLIEDMEKSVSTIESQHPDTLAPASEKKELSLLSPEPDTQNVILDFVPEDHAVEYLINGVARLIEGQRRFADEFGLSYERVFSHGFDAKNGQELAGELKTAIRDQGPERAAIAIGAVFENLYEHQTALLSVFDTVSRRTIKYLSPEVTEEKSGKLNKFTSLWRRYKERHEKIASDPRRRQKLIIAPGVAVAYTKARERLKGHRSQDD